MIQNFSYYSWIALDLSKTHPLIIHLPIGILFFAAFLYSLKLWKKDSSFDQAISLALGLSVISSLLSVVSGLFLAKGGDYDPNYLNKHKWFGIGTAVITLILYVVFSRKKSSKLLTSGLVGLTVILLIITGHFGGTLTHGADFLTTTPKLDSGLQIASNIEDTQVYSGLVQPILNKKCNSCHNPNKQKGELVMTSIAGILKGGESGEILNLEHPGESELLARLFLPMTDKLHMPPKGKLQLEDDEVTLLRWWIENKACTDCLVAETIGAETIEPVLQRLVEAESNGNKKLKPVSAKQVKALEHSNIKISSISASDPGLSLTLLNQENITPGMLRAMKPVKKNIIKLNLGFSEISPQMIKFISKLENLEVLQLQKSNVSNDQLRKLKKLKQLKMLNIYGTNIDDDAIEDLAEFESLEQLFAWESSISENGIQTLKNKQPNLFINAGIEADIFGASKLNPPVILAEKILFNDQLEVRIKNYVSNSNTYYTDDGTEPDTTDQVYTKPIKLGSTTLIKAVTTKPGWEKSEPVSKQFIKLGSKVVDVSIVEKPKKPYLGNGAKTLIDQQENSTDFRNGKWLGFEGTHATVTLTLEEENTITNVFVSALSDPGSWIFYPKAIHVETSLNGKNFKFIKEVTLSSDKRDGSELKFFKVDFPPTEAKYVRVKISSILSNPDWHPAPGGKSWLFIEEVFAE